MRKYKSKILIIVLLLISLVITFAPEKASAAEGIEVNASFGIDGMIKVNSSVPATIEVKNTLGQDFKGLVEILVPNLSSAKDSYGEEIEIKKGETKKIILPVNNLVQGNKVKIKVSQDGNIFFEREIVVSNKSINEYGQNTIAIFAEDKETLKYLSNIGGEDNKGNGAQILELSRGLLSSNYKNLQMIDMIIINKFDSASLTDIEIKSLNTWIKNGGVLIIGGNEKTLNPLNNKLIKASITKGVSTQVKLEAEDVNLVLGKLSGEVGTKILSDGDNILATRVKNGTGSIILTSFDLEDKNFTEFSKVSEVFSKIIDEDLTRIFSGGGMSSNYPYELDQVLNTIPLDKEINVSNVVILLLIFIVLVSFGSYFLLKIIKKRSYIWIVIPVLSVMVTFVMFTIGKETSLNEKILNSINVVKIDSEGNAKTSSYLSIGNKYKSNLKIEEPEGIKIENIVSPNNMYGQEASNNSSDKVTVKTVYNGDKTYYDFNEISALDLKKFKIMGQESKYNKLTSELNYVDSSLSGTFKNPIDTDIEELYIVFGNNVFSVGQVKEGETYKFNSQKAISQNGINQYVGEMYNNYYSDLMMNSNDVKEKYKGVIRNASILNLISSNSGKEPYYIALTKDKIDFGINFGDEEVSEYYQTAYVGDIKVNLKDSEGNTVYPLGYIVPVAELSQSKLFIDPISYIAMDSGESVMGYNLGEKFIVKEITIDILPKEEDKSQNGMNGNYEVNVKYGDANFNGSIKIYNYKTDTFDDVSYTYGTPLKLNNLDQYVLNGMLRIKYIGKNEQGGRIPVIAAKGRLEK